MKEVLYSINILGQLIREARKKAKMSQAMLAPSLNIDYTVLSKIETGKITPSGVLIKEICTELKIKGDEKDRLYQAYKAHMLGKEGITDDSFVTADVVEFIHNELSGIKKMRSEGLPMQAVERAENKIDFIKKSIATTINKSQKVKLLNILGEVLLEASKSYMDFLSPNEVWAYMNPIIETQELVSKELSSPKLSLLAILSRESAYYVEKKYDKAYSLSLKLLSNINELPADWQKIEVLRAFLINIGYLNYEREIRDAEKKVNLLLPALRNKPMDSVFLLEGLARAKTLLGEKNAEISIQKAWDFLDQGKKTGMYSSLKRVQLIRTQLKFLIKNDNTNKIDIDRIGSEGLIISKEYNYTRYKKEIEDLLDKNL